MKNRQRYGQAPLEIALALPIVVLMFVFLYFITSVAVTRITATGSARSATFRDRHKTDPGNGITEELARPPRELTDIKEPIEYRHELPDRLTSIEADEDVPPILKLFSKLGASAKSNSTVYTGTWDYRTLPQEPEQEHKRLHLSESLVPFLKKANRGRRDLDLFARKFANVSGGVGRGSLAQLGNLKSGYKRTDVPSLANTAESHLISRIENSEDPGEIRRLLDDLSDVRDTQGRMLDGLPQFKSKEKKDES